MKNGIIAAGLGLAVSGVASAAFTGYTVLSTNFSSGGLNLTRHELFANFNGANDTVLNVFNFQALGGWGAHASSAAGFWHKDNSNGGTLSQSLGNWAPQQTGDSASNRPFDSYLLIGGEATSGNSTSLDPSWDLAGTGGSSQAQIPTADLLYANLLGWFNPLPPNNQGRVGVGANSPTQVKLGQFVLSQNDTAFRTYSLHLAWNIGVGTGANFVDGTFMLPAPGAVALLGLAGLTRRSRR